MKKSFIITEAQKDQFDIISKKIVDLQRVICQLSQIIGAWRLTIQGTESDVIAYIERLEVMGIILST